MTRNFPEWAYLMGASGRYWHNLAKGNAKQEKVVAGSRPPGRALFGIATHDLISSAQWISSNDPAIVSQIVNLENEKHGIDQTDGPGRVHEWAVVESADQQSLIQSLTLPWPLTDIDGVSSDFVDYLPQFSLYSAPRNAIALWKEGEHLVMGYSRNTDWVHVQTLAFSSTPEEIAQETNLTLLELTAKGVLPDIERVVVWLPYEMALHEALQKGIGLPVEFDAVPAPSESPGWDFEPHEISYARIAKANRRRNFLTIFACVILLFGLLAAGILDLWIHGLSHDRLKTRVLENREEASEIQITKARWEALHPAISPERSPLELFHQVTQLIPENGFRLTQFRVENFNKVSIMGEGSEMGNALQFGGALENAPGLSDYEWAVPQPEKIDDLATFDATGTYRN